LRPAVLLVIALSIFFTGTVQWGQDFIREKLLSQLIHTGLQRLHYSKRQIDDDYSRLAFKEFLSYMDYSKRFFLEEDIRELQEYSDKIDNQFAEGSTELMQKATALLEKRIRQVMGYYEELLAKPFDFSKEEFLEVDPEKRTYNKTLQQQKSYWRKVFKYYTLNRYIAYQEVEKKKKENASKKSKDKNSTPPKKNEKPKTPEQMENEARDSVRKSFKNIFNRLLQANTNDALSRYLNSLVQVIDPHSAYYQPVDKETFDMEISGSFEGIGALLRNEDEYVKVESIIPGGPSWRQKQLEAGDLIIKVAQGKGEYVDIIGMRTTDAVKLIRGKKGTLVRLTVKKPDGQIVEIPIVRDVVVLEETFAKSLLLVHKKTGKKYGYIHLPSFYNDFKGGRNSTDDVRIELNKLKPLGIEGVILDLRNNRGGALMDAVRMSGLFLPDGPMVQVKNNAHNIEVLEDTNKAVHYDGPLVVLVNQLSASASEILAAAMQDYNRAVIVGGLQSYGKGTVQAMVNLDRFITRGPAKDMKFGALSITIQQFYRVTGKPIQQKGVTPDVTLPDRFDSLEIGEKYLDHSMKPDTIPSASISKWSPVPLVTNEMIKRSQTRVKKNNAFDVLDQYVLKVKQMRDDTRQSLRESTVKNEQEEIRKERKKLDILQKPLNIFDVKPSSELDKNKSKRLQKIDKEIRDSWFKDVKKDLVLGEALEIINDMVTLKKK
jgi:carboxyl-terminal processing protease